MWAGEFQQWSFWHMFALSIILQTTNLPQKYSQCSTWHRVTQLLRPGERQDDVQSTGLGKIWAVRHRTAQRTLTLPNIARKFIRMDLAASQKSVNLSCKSYYLPSLSFFIARHLGILSLCAQCAVRYYNCCRFNQEDFERSPRCRGGWSRTGPTLSISIVVLLHFWYLSDSIYVIPWYSMSIYPIFSFAFSTANSGCQIRWNCSFCVSSLTADSRWSSRLAEWLRLDKVHSYMH